MNFLSRISGAYGWLKRYVVAHKIISGIMLIVLLGGGWYIHGALTSTSGQTSYILGTVSTSTVISTIAESGQVSATNQVSVQAKVSGNVTWVGVKVGETVAAGQTLVQLDSTDAQQAVTNAQIALKAEELTLAQDTAQAPIDYQNTQTAVTQAQLDLSNEYDNVYSTLSNTYASLPAIMSSAHDLLYTNSINNSYNNVDAYQNYFVNADSATQSTMKLSANRANSDYSAALTSYNTSYTEFKGITRSSAPADVEKVLNDTDASAKLISQALGSDVNLIDTTVNLLTLLNYPVSSAITSQQTSAHTQLTNANSVLSSISSQVTSLQSAKDALTTAQQNLQLASIGNPNGTNPFSLQQEQNNVDQKKAALATAQQTLSYYTIRAPFAGVIAAVNVQVGDTTGSSAVATLVTNTQYVDLSVNEVDAAKISLGQRATMTFDAIPNLTLTGVVAQINPVGTVSQGVVTYDVQVSLDTQDSEVKSGMTANATIQTAVHQNVLVVSSSAIKTQGTASYVQVFKPAIASSTVAAANTSGIVTTQTPINVPVTVGISDTTNSEITSGLSAGEQIIVRTTGNSTAPTAAAAATTRGGGGGFGGGGAIRIGG